MIDVAQLLSTDAIPGNYFASGTYFQADFEAGLIENRSQSRLVALPETLLKALHHSLQDEVGEAAAVVLFQCGFWWGKSFYQRFQQEVSAYYGRPLAELEMVELIQCLQQCWQTHGWGKFDLDLSYAQQGYLVATVQHSPFAATSTTGKRPHCFTEAGIFSAFFSQLTGRDLHCIQTTCETLGAPMNTFVLGLRPRVSVVEAWLAEKHDHDTIMERLCQNQRAA